VSSRPREPGDLAPVVEMPPTGAKGAVLQEIFEAWVAELPPGSPIPSERDLAEHFGVARMTVRQALDALVAEGLLERIQGRGTFVAEPKLDARAGGLSRSLLFPRPADVAIQALDVRTVHVEESIQTELQTDADEAILRVTSCLSLRGVPLSISYSFFRRAEVAWLERAVHPGRNVPADLVLADHGIELAQARIAVETSQCGQFEADRFGIPHRAAVFLAVCTEFRRDGDTTRPFEVARVEYRGDLLRFRLEVSAGGPGAMEALWELTEPAVPAAGPPPSRA